MNDNSTLILGNHQTGKTRNILFNEISKKINDKESFVILDIHGDYYNHFAKQFKDNGYRINVINLNNANKSDGWNPLSYPYFLMHEELKSYDLAVEQLENMAKEIFYEEKEEDPFWRTMCENLFVGLSLLLIRMSKNNDDHKIAYFPTIMLLLNIAEKRIDDTTVMRKYLESLEATDPVYIALSPIFFAPAETKGSIMAVFKMKMNQYMLRKDLVSSMLYNSYSEARIEDGKTVVFIQDIPNRLTNIIISQCFTEAFRTKQKVNFILDEFDQLPKFLTLEDRINQARKSNVSIYLTAINNSLIEKKYKDFIVDKTITLDDIYKTDYTDEEIEYIGDPFKVSYEEGYSDKLLEWLLELI